LVHMAPSDRLKPFEGSIPYFICTEGEKRGRRK